MAFSWIAWVDRVKDAAFGYQTVNSIGNDLNYLKQQTEVLVDQDATAISSGVVTAAALQTPTVAVNGNMPFADSSATGGLRWGGIDRDSIYWAMGE